jgi:hypothetical protein
LIVLVLVPSTAEDEDDDENDFSKEADMTQRRLVSILIMLQFALPVALAAETRFQVKHEHVLGSCRGELVFGESTLEYVTKDRQDARVWKYQDIQQLGLLSPHKLSVLTYEDRRIEFGKDKRFIFQITEGEISEDLWKYLQGHLTKPLMSVVLPSQASVKYELPVKHLHALGGCQGTLKVADQYLTYETSHPSDSRIWRYQDISTMGSTGPFQLRLTTMERVGGELSGEKNFIFDLKQRLESEVYDFIWWKINGPNISPVSQER